MSEFLFLPNKFLDKSQKDILLPWVNRGKWKQLPERTIIFLEVRDNKDEDNINCDHCSKISFEFLAVSLRL